MSTCCNRMFHAFQMYVAYVSSIFCKSRSGVAYVAIATHMCCKCMFQLFQTYVAYVAVAIHVCCKCVSKCFSCFIWMLHVFIWMLYMLQWLYTYGASVCSKCFTYFRRMLQAFYLDVVIWCSGYTHMLQTYVSIVSLGFSMLQQVLLPTRSNSWARTRCTHPSSAAYLCHAGTDLTAAAGMGREASRVGAAACGCADVRTSEELAWPFTICKQPYIKNY
jgi:hypothetical protein